MEKREFAKPIHQYSHKKIVEERRKCGECTACCKTHPVSSLNKEMSVWCKNCDIGKGCKIYPDRPKDCNDFMCQWLKGYSKEKDRPDKTKIVVDFYEIKELGEKVASLWEVSEGALEGNYAKVTTKELLAGGVPVLHIYLGGRRVLYLKGKLTGEKRKLFTEDGIEIVQQ